MIYFEFAIVNCCKDTSNLLYRSSLALAIGITFRLVNELLVAIPCNHSWRGFICVKHALRQAIIDGNMFAYIYKKIYCTDCIVCVYCDQPNNLRFMLKDLKKFILAP